MSKAMILVNPFSGRKQAAQIASRLGNILHDKYDTVVLVETQNKLMTEKIAGGGCDQGFKAIYVVGGDGTLNSVINGVAPKSSRPIIGVIPAGTVNNYARMLKLPLNPHAAIEVMRNPDIIKSDIGKVNERYFISSISVGELSAKVKKVKHERKRKYGRLAYVSELGQALNDNTLNCFRLIMDGRQIDDVQLSLLVIGLGNSLGGISTFFPHHTIDDGKLSYIGLKHSSLLDKLSLIPKVFNTRELSSSHLIYGTFQMGTITLDGDQTVAVAIDGEEGPDLPLMIRVLPRHIAVFAPAAE